MDGVIPKAFRFFNRRTGEHFYTANAAERDGIIAGMPDMAYEGVAFLQGGGASNPVSVARFVRLDTGEHFYTASVTERDYILQTMADAYRLEDPQAFLVSATPDSLFSQPVYRFVDTATGSHFFTASEGERDGVAASLSSYRYEGVAFYAKPTPPLAPSPAGDFDESWYLQAYPDVRDAVTAGWMTARSHYDLFGKREGRMPSDMAVLTGNDHWIAFDGAPGHVRILHGGSGDDILDGIDGYSISTSTMVGAYNGYSDYSDVLFGETGNDTLYGAQNDTLNGGSGDDTYYVHSSGVLVTEGSDAGTDELFLIEDSTSGYFNYSIPANVERMRVFINPIANLSVPTIAGSTGDDWISAGSTNTQIRLLGAAGNDTLNGGSGGAVVEGGTGNDYLLAVGYNDARFYTWVSSANDTLSGGDGDDTLVAWTGNDRLTGGTGADTFLVDLGSPPNRLWQDPKAWTSYRGPSGSSYVPWLGESVTTVTDFQPGVDVLSFHHTSLSLADIMARFNDRGDGMGVVASFTTDELGLSVTSGTGNGFTLSLDNVKQWQISADWFSVSPT
ncbi:calcium-binding protein [Azospirillum sp. B506]|uniref:calcium-binding protein n=1 Tax=Azospirillum sp. B506 TaxID=137721 RepID=UPI00034594E5|nr:calcium-binding protein [Azospirillum sp. B506]